jgi:hypothetical protein
MAFNFYGIKTLLHWLFTEIKYAWLAFGFIAIALVLSLWFWPTERVIRLTGLVLQLAGIGTVIWGISDTRARFGHPTFASKVKAWLRRFPFIKRINVLNVDSIISTSFCGDARAYGTYGVGENPTIESLAESLEKNVKALHERISAAQNDMDDGLQKATKALKQEEQARQSVDNDIRKMLESTATGGFHIAEIGAAWLIVGAILSTAAPEIADLIRCLYTDDISPFCVSIRAIPQNAAPLRRASLSL